MSVLSFSIEQAHSLQPCSRAFPDTETQALKNASVMPSSDLLLGFFPVPNMTHSLDELQQLRSFWLHDGPEAAMKLDGQLQANSHILLIVSVKYLTGQVHEIRCSGSEELPKRESTAPAWDFITGIETPPSADLLRHSSMSLVSLYGRFADA